jgi:hypothetical protein
MENEAEDADYHQAAEADVNSAYSAATTVAAIFDIVAGATR